MGSERDYRSAFEEQKEALAKDQKLFEDPEFPAGPAAIHSRRSYWDRDIKWLRPKEICKDPKFIVEGATRFDLNQGALNDCWFIAASACLATSNKQLFEWCVPLDQEFDDKYAGIFHFHFWQFGTWVEVTIDDRLPCREVFGKGEKKLELVYARNELETNEFWAPLFEKAYAKLNGCYENLNGGFSSDALVDFTGGISEFIDITPKRGSPGNLFEMLSAMMKMSSLIGTHINGQTPRPLANGLFTGHAYSITNVVQLDGTSHRLLRLRNPWGKDEWNGRWSDDSSDWAAVPEEVKKKIEMRKRLDGEFWMSFDDWLANFERLTICHLDPEGVTEEISENDGRETWDHSMHQWEWMRGVNAGGAGGFGSQPDERFWKNPQYPIVLDPSHRGTDGTSHVVVSLMQRAPNNQCTLDIGFALCQLRDDVPLRSLGESYDSNEVTSVRKEPSKPLREVCVHYELTPGNYIIIPFTQLYNTEGEFLLRIFTEIQH